MSDFHPEWLADLGPWHTVGDTPFLARCLPSDPDAAILILRPWGPWAERRWRAVFSPPDRDDDGQDWRHGEILAPDGRYWPDRESAEAALDAAWSAWRERYRGSQGLAPDDPRRRNLPSAVLARIKALGYVPGETSVGAHVWLVGKAEEMHAAAADLRHEIDALRRERHAERQRVQERDAEIAEMRLTLAAEQGKPEGAPSEGWAFVGGVWKKGNFSVWSDADGWDVLWFNHGAADEIGTYETAKAAMLAADKALETP